MNPSSLNLLFAFANDRAGRFLRHKGYIIQLRAVHRNRIRQDSGSTEGSQSQRNPIKVERGSDHLIWQDVRGQKDEGEGGVGGDMVWRELLIRHPFELRAGAESRRPGWSDVWKRRTARGIWFGASY